MSRTHRPNPLRLEALSAREVPAALVGNTLFVDGDAGDNVMSIDTAGGNIVVRQTNANNNLPQHFPITSVGRIVARGFAGDDRVSLVRLPQGMPTMVGLGDGNDVAVIGAGILAIGPANLTIHGEGGTDTVAGPTTLNNMWNLTGLGRGTVAGAQFHTTERLAGGWMTDTFWFNPGAQFTSIDGGFGVDWLDYTGSDVPAVVDLTAGSATGLAAGGLSDIENVTGSKYNDRLWGNADHNLLVGLDGNDVIGGREGFDRLDGGAGLDRLDGGDGDDSLDAGIGDDSLTGGDGDDRMFGREGNDFLNGGTGHDSMDGGAGDDLMFGQEGLDHMWGMAGADLMFGGSDADRMFGGDDRDILFGGDGTDALDGGAGDDILGSGSASYERDLTDLSGLMAIRAEWTSDRGYVERVLNLRGDNGPNQTTGVNGSHFLETHGPTPTVTHPNGPEDSLVGGTGDDWFFGHADEYDPLAWGDREAGERVNA